MGERAEPDRIMPNEHLSSRFVILRTSPSALQRGGIVRTKGDEMKEYLEAVEKALKAVREAMGKEPEQEEQCPPRN